MLSERNYPPAEAIRVPGVPLHPKASPPPVAPIAAVVAPPEEAPRLWQFNLQHPTLPGCVSVTVHATTANARGLAYLVAEEFCAQVIGQIKASE